MPDLADPQQRIRPSGPNGEKSPEFWQELKKLYDYVRQIVPSGSGGDVVGPSGVTANAPALFNGTTGKIIKAGTLNQLVPTSGAANGLFLGFAGGIPAWLANTFTIADGSITLAKITNIPAGTFLARKVPAGILVIFARVILPSAMVKVLASHAGMPPAKPRNRPFAAPLVGTSWLSVPALIILPVVPLNNAGALAVTPDGPTTSPPLPDGTIWRT